MNKKGFTLVELVITIAIVIILSVVSVPIYRGYTEKAKIAEGYALLGMILSAQKAYYSEYGNFLSWANSSSGSSSLTNNEEVLGIDARGNKYFTWFEINNGGTGAAGSAHLKFYFDSSVYASELKDGANLRLGLQFNLTKGPKYVNFSNGGKWDSSYYAI